MASWVGGWHGAAVGGPPPSQRAACGLRWRVGGKEQDRLARNACLEQRSGREMEAVESVACAGLSPTRDCLTSCAAQAGIEAARPMPQDAAHQCA